MAADRDTRAVAGTATARNSAPPFGARSAALAPPRIAPPSTSLRPRQREILDELDAILVEEGFAQLTIGALAARLRCSRRALYELAPTKDELVLVVLDRRLRRTGAFAAQALAKVDDAADRLEAFLLAGSSELKRTTLRFREDVARFPGARRLIAAHYRYATALVGEMIDAGIELGRFRPVQSRIVAEIIDAALERLQDPEILREQDLSFEEAAAELTMLLRNGLAVETAGTAKANGQRTSAAPRWAAR